jgi:hypothetical protein
VGEETNVVLLLWNKFRIINVGVSEYQIRQNPTQQIDFDSPNASFLIYEMEEEKRTNSFISTATIFSEKIIRNNSKLDFTSEQLWVSFSTQHQNISKDKFTLISLIEFGMLQNTNQSKILNPSNKQNEINCSQFLWFNPISNACQNRTVFHRHQKEVRMFVFFVILFLFVIFLFIFRYRGFKLLSLQKYPIKLLSKL